MARVLIVDDEPAVADGLRLHLTMKGHEASTAYSGSAALRQVKADRPHLILLDLRMPVMDGFEVLRCVREMDHEVAVIVVTAVAEIDIGRLALLAGAADFITKPIDLAYLDSSVAAALAPRLLPNAVDPA
jgi:two-component system response regulator AtoC